MQATLEDRGLDTAYERWCFSRLLCGWAKEYAVTSAMEGPLDGTEGVRGVHCVGLARDGVRVVTAVGSEASASVTRAIYGASAAEQRVDVRVTDATHLAELPACDMVLVYRGLRLADDWRSYLRTMAGLARTVLVIATCNPDNWAFSAQRFLRRAPAPDACRTVALAPLLWEIGRVRDHVYFDAPLWPPRSRRNGDAVAHRSSTKHVYGSERWPYFGGAGWADELEPALVGRRTLEKARPGVLRRAARLHAFVVDVRPRTPQARRRLSLARPEAG